MQKKKPKNDSRAGKMTIFGFSRSAPGLATRTGRENDKKMTKNAKPNDNEMQTYMTKNDSAKQK